MGEHIVFADKPLQPIKGHAGFATQLPGCATTVGNMASATGGIKAGNLITTDR